MALFCGKIIKYSRGVMIMVLDIITKLYESSHFTTGLICVISLLVAIFSIILFKGIKDLKKESGESVFTKEPEKDITFEMPEEPINNEFENIAKEEVTFEAPNLTQNLADFKNVIEEEIKQDTEVPVQPLEKIELVEDDKKPIKILDIDEIEDTSIFPSLDGSIDRFFSLNNNDENVNLDVNSVRG